MSALTPAWLIAYFNSGMARNACASLGESKVWITMMSLGSSVERRT